MDAHTACGRWKEIFMIEGTLIAESLRAGTSLENLNLIVSKISTPPPTQPGVQRTSSEPPQVTPSEIPNSRAAG